MRPASVSWTVTPQTISKRVKGNFQALMLPRSILINCGKVPLINSTLNASDGKYIEIPITIFPVKQRRSF